MRGRAGKLLVGVGVALGWAALFSSIIKAEAPPKVRIGSDVHFMGYEGLSTGKVLAAKVVEVLPGTGAAEWPVVNLEVWYQYPMQNTNPTHGEDLEGWKSTVHYDVKRGPRTYHLLEDCEE